MHMYYCMYICCKAFQYELLTHSSAMAFDCF